MPRKSNQEERIKKYMATLNLSYEEAKQCVIDDDIIDAGGTCEWEEEMTPEQKKIARKARMADRAISTEKVKRTRNEDPDKRELIDTLESALRAVADTVVVSNAEREIELEFNGRQFKVTLSAPRAKKA